MDASAGPAPTVVASTDGVSIAVHELGGTGRPLLWCHATGFHGRVWRAAAAGFPDRRNLALDFRGYGDSTAPPPEDLDWTGFGEDVLAVVDHFGLTELQAVGHSKGGAALLMAAIARPGAFERLVLFEPIVFPSENPDDFGARAIENPMAEAARRRKERFDSVAAAVERFGSKPPLGSLRADVLEDYVRFGFRPQGDAIVLKAAREHEARTYELGSRHQTFARLTEVDIPVLVAASGDGGMPAQFAPAVADRLPRGELRHFDHLTHFGPLEDPDGFGAVVRDFFA